MKRIAIALWKLSGDTVSAQLIAAKTTTSPPYQKLLAIRVATEIVRRNWKNATEAQSHREKTRVRGDVRSCQLGGGVAAKSGSATEGEELTEFVCSRGPA